VRIHFSVPSDDVNIVRHIAKFPRFSEISRHEREEYGDRKAEPEICGAEKEVVVAENVSDEPTRRNCRIEYCEDPHKYNTYGYGKEYPSRPDASVQTIEQVGYHDGRNYHCC